MKQKTLNQCQECDQIFKYDRQGKKLQEHYDRFHSLPQFTKNGKISLNACHQITLIVKNEDTWKQYFNKQKKKDTSWIRDGQILQKFEQDNNVEFQYCKSNEEISFRKIKIPLSQRIKFWFLSWWVS